MSIEAEAVTELFQITYQGTMYTFKIASAAAHGVAAILGFIKSALASALSKDKTQMDKIQERRGNLVAYPMSAEHYKVFKKQAYAADILYKGVPVAEDGNDTVMVFVGEQDAYRVNKVIEANHLNVIATETPEQMAQKDEAEKAPEQSEQEFPGPVQEVPDADQLIDNSAAFAKFNTEPPNNDGKQDGFADVTNSIDDILSGEEPQNPTNPGKDHPSVNELSDTSTVPFSHSMMNDRPSVYAKVEQYKTEPLTTQPDAISKSPDIERFLQTINK